MKFKEMLSIKCLTNEQKQALKEEDIIQEIQILQMKAHLQKIVGDW